MNREGNMLQRLLAMTITSVLLLIPAALNAQEEMMMDPSFELQTAETLDGEMWYEDGDGLIITVELDAGTARTGANCVAITGNNEWTGIGQGPIYLIPETEYILSVWVQGGDIENSGTLGLWDEIADDGFELWDWNANSEEWVELTLTFTSFAAEGEYWFWLGSEAAAEGVVFRVDDISLMESTVSVEEATDAMPAEYALGQNYPNPFNPTTTMEFVLPAAGAVEMAVYDLAGHKVRTLRNENMSSGVYTVTWNGRDDAGNEATTGLYFYRLTAGGTSLTKKMLLLK